MLTDAGDRSTETTSGTTRSEVGAGRTAPRAEPSTLSTADCDAVVSRNVLLKFLAASRA